MNIIATLAPSIRSLAREQVNLRFDNVSHQVRYLASPRIGRIAFDGNYFIFSDPHVSYLGRAIKRAPYRHDEMIVLPPGTHVEYTVDLTDYYDLSRCQRPTVFYQAAHPILESGAIMEIIESNRIDIG